MSTASATPLPTSSLGLESTSSQTLPTFGMFSNSTAAPNSRKQGAVNLDQGLPRPFKSAPAPSALAESDAVSEEGELSEGEFEDLYEPKALSGPFEEKPKHQTHAILTNGDPTGSAGDADGSSIYDTGSTQEEMVIDSTSASQPAVDEDDDYEPGEYEPLYQHRDKSGSYSPHLSPEEPPRPAASLPEVGGPVAQGSFCLCFPVCKPANPRTGFAPPTQSLSSSVHGNASKHTADQAIAPSVRDLPVHANLTPAVATPSSLQATTASPFKSVSEAKKKAQEAILGLWPLKVRYQNYLDEGLDPHVVKSLFTELGLDTSQPKPTTQEPTVTSPSVQTEKGPPTRSSPKPTLQPSSTSVDLPQSATENAASGSEAKTEPKKSAQEERKDKIARMLAEKSKKGAAKPAVSTPSVQAAAVASNASETSDPAKIKLRAQNNQKILEKLAALKKQQGQKPETTGQKAIVSVPESHGKKSLAPSEALVAEAGPNRAAHSSLGEPDASSTPASRLGLSASSSPRSTPKPRNMKRPIASDFDGYSSNGSALKRTRTQETLIIDVSDDEDVEMDLGSPTDPPSTAAIHNNTLPRQNSLAAFPPLSGSRSWHGQKLTPATPATATPSEHGHKLDFLTQQIEEAKRKIAEAEAKKVAIKRPSEVSTPLAQSPAPASASLESLRVPKRSEISLASRRKRRDRIASYHIPVLDTVLREKQEKLQRLREEAAQLSIEVQATLEERQKLTGEMETLDLSKSASPELDSPSEPALSGKSSLVASTNSTDTFLATSQVEAQDIAVAESASVGALLPSAEPIISPEHIATSEQATQTLVDSANIELGTKSSTSSGVSDTEIVAGPEVTLIQSPSSANSIDVDTHLSHASPSVDVLSSDSGTNVDDKVAQHDDTELSSNGGTHANQVFPEADVPMQISDAEDDDYESVPAQISDADHIHVAGGEAGEAKMISPIERLVIIKKQIPDQEPYEPDVAQVLGPVPQPFSDAASGEVQNRASGEPHLLTTEQAASPSGNLTAKDLLSYQSPLRYFHAYKFHPRFLENVSGGLKSMTYSTKIDASRPVCPSLIDGGQCPNGSSCEFQHFDKMVLSGKCAISFNESKCVFIGSCVLPPLGKLTNAMFILDPAIIAELGSTDMFTGEQKDRFIDGLKKVLSDLKVNKLKDFDSITRALIQYRIEFIGDKSKVLPLEDVAI